MNSPRPAEQSVTGGINRAGGGPERVDLPAPSGQGRLPYRPGWIDALVVLLLAGLCAAMYLPRLGARGPWTAGEARAVLTPRLMLDRGEWVAMRMPTEELRVTDERGVPVIDDLKRGAYLERLLEEVQVSAAGRVEPRPFDFEQRITIHKPVGYYWLIAGLGRLGMPITVTTARLTSSISAMLTVVGVYLLGCYLFSRRAGLIAAVALATSVHFVWITRVAKMDMVITLLMTASLALFYLAHTSRHNVLASLVMYGVLAGAVLIKGPGYLGIPVLVIGCYLVVEYIAFRPAGGFWRYLWGQMRRLYVGPGILIVAALAVPWYWMIHLKTGGQWTDVMFLRHHLARFGVYEYGKEFEAKTTPLFYLYMVWPLLFPWAIFLPGALVEVFRKRSRRLLRQSLFVLAWFGFMGVFFSVMKFRKDEYLMPAYPAIMLLAGLLLDQYLPSGRRGRAAQAGGGGDAALDRAIRAAYVFVAVCAVGVIGFAVAMRWPATMRLVLRIDDNRNTATAMRVIHGFVRDQSWVLFACAGAIVALLATALWAQFTKRVRAALGVLAIGSAALIVGLIHVLMTQIDPYRSEWAFAGAVEQRILDDAGQPGDPIILFGVENYELLYWFDQDGRSKFSRPDAWKTYRLFPLTGVAGQTWSEQFMQAAGLDPRSDERGMNVIIAQCRWWVSQGRTPYLIVERGDLAGLWASGPFARKFRTVLGPDEVGPEYPRHRMPLVLLRLAGAD